MDPRFHITREEFLELRMDLKRLYSIQQQQSERLRVLEKRQADEASLKSVWQSPFPSALGGTPQQGPVHVPRSDEAAEDDLDEQTQSLLGSLHLEADDEPIRRGAASRANSVRFDESALHGANWAQSRHSGDFGPIGSSGGLGGHQMERSLSYKSDGRHSSAGHSVHSMQSGVSGRASSIGLDTNFSIGGRDDDSSVGMPEPSRVLFVLPSAPTIIRCWLTPDFTSASLLYAVVSSASSVSAVAYSLLKELNLVDQIHRDPDGVDEVSLSVYLAEARVLRSHSRSPSPAQLPSISCSFKVMGSDQAPASSSKSIRVFIGSDTLRLHSADILLSSNSMTLYSDNRDKLNLPFIRPEDDSVYKNLSVCDMAPGKPKLNAAAPEFVSSDKAATPQAQPPDRAKSVEAGSEGVLSPTSRPPESEPGAKSTASQSGGEDEKPGESTQEAGAKKEGSTATEGRREFSAAIQTSWRQAVSGGSESGLRDSTPLSGYQPAPRSRSMKILRPMKSSSKTGTAQDGSKPGDPRRRGQESQGTSLVGGSGWGKRSTSVGTSRTSGSGGEPSQSSTVAANEGKEAKSPGNSLGGAMAFSWIPTKTSQDF